MKKNAQQKKYAKLLYVLSVIGFDHFVNKIVIKSLVDFPFTTYTQCCILFLLKRQKMHCFVLFKQKSVQKSHICTLEYEEFKHKKTYIENAILTCTYERVRKKYFEFTWINGSHYTESVVARGYAHPFKSKVIFFFSDVY